MVELDKKEVEINGDTFTLSKLPAEIAWFMALRIIEANGKSAGALSQAGEIGGVVGAASALGHAQSALAAIIRDKAFFTEVVKPLWGVCLRNGTPAIGPMWSMDYANQLDTLLLLYQAQVNFNFGPFLDAFGRENDVIAALTPAIQQPTQRKTAGSSRTA